MNEIKFTGQILFWPAIGNLIEIPELVPEIKHE
jgi:hypothetical protein